MIEHGRCPMYAAPKRTAEGVKEKVSNGDATALLDAIERGLDAWARRGLLAVVLHSHGIGGLAHNVLDLVATTGTLDVAVRSQIGWSQSCETATRGGEGVLGRAGHALAVQTLQMPTGTHTSARQGTEHLTRRISSESCTNQVGR